MYGLTRLLFRALNGKPLLQVIVGILLIPVGGLISYVSIVGSDGYVYPYWIVGGIVFAIVGVIFIIRGAKTLLRPKSSVQQAMLHQTPYTGPNQYAQQPAYGQPQYPPQAYGQPQYPQQAYGQPQYPPQAYGQLQYPQQAYGQAQQIPYSQPQAYEQLQYPQE